MTEARWWAATEHADGVGIVLGDHGDVILAGIDLDSCRDENTTELSPWARPVVDRFNTYAEVSPSKKGVKLLFVVARADLQEIEALLGGGRRGRAFKNGGGEHPEAIEIYFQGRYFVTTEDSFGPVDELRLVDLADIKWLVLEAGPKFADQGAKAEGAKGNGKDQSRSAKAFRAAVALRDFGASYEAVRDALLAHGDADIAEWARTKGLANTEREMHRIYDKAGSAESAVQLEDFVAFMQSHDYIYMPGGDFWPRERVDARLKPILLFDRSGKPIVDNKGVHEEMSASAWLAKHAPVEQMTWAPGLPQLVRDKLISAGGWVERKGVTVLNLYRPPTIESGDATKAGPWLSHARKIYPAEAKHIIAFLAHRVQKPHEKINHGLVLGGLQGIGKDTLLEPVKHAVGPWNFKEVSPQHILGRFNGYLKSVVLRISEAKDMGEFDRFKFYARTKSYLAAPPDVLRVDEKNLREHDVVNVCGIIMTTNHRTDGVHLPADDRRHFVAWSDRTKDDFDEAYWRDLWDWYEREGFGHVAAYLAELDLEDFNPKAPPPKTEAFWAIVDANRPPEDAELADILDGLGENAVTLDMILAKATGGLEEWLSDRKNRRVIPHRLETCGYTPVRNAAADDGLFKIRRRRQAVYAKTALPMGERLRAAYALAK